MAEAQPPSAPGESHGRDLGRGGVNAAGILAFVAALLASLLAQHAVVAGLPATLMVQIVKAAALVAAGQTAATGIISTKVAALTEGGLKAMWMTKLKTAAALVLTGSIVASSAGVLVPARKQFVTVMTLV